MKAPRTKAFQLHADGRVCRLTRLPFRAYGLVRLPRLFLQLPLSLRLFFLSVSRFASSAASRVSTDAAALAPCHIQVFALPDNSSDPVETTTE